MAFGQYYFGFHDLLYFRHETIFKRNILKDLSCRVIRAVTQHWPPFSYIIHNPGVNTNCIKEKFNLCYEDNSIDGSKKFDGAEVTLFKAIAKALNFDYIIREPQICCGFGDISSGITGEMIMGLSDIAWSQQYFIEWYWLRFDMTTSYNEDQACFMVN